MALTRVHGVWREQVPAGTVDFAQFDLHVRRVIRPRVTPERANHI